MESMSNIFINMNSYSIIVCIVLIQLSLNVNGRYLDQDRYVNDVFICLIRYVLFFSLKTDHTLHNDNCLVSSDKRFYLCMQNDGNLVIYKGVNAHNRHAIWASNTMNKGSHPHRLIMQKDGNLVIYDSQNNPIWATNTHDRGATNAFMVIQSDGNFVVYNSSPVSPLWASGTHGHGQIDCHEESSWPHDWIQFENQVLELVNEVRSKGVSCGGHWKSPVAPLKLNSKLIQSSRCHAIDMIKKNYFSHVSPDGQTIGNRIRQTGYSFRAVAENIAHGQRSPHDVMNSWLRSSGHCLNIMTDYQEIGIAFVGDKHMWVQNFGTSF